MNLDENHERGPPVYEHIRWLCTDRSVRRFPRLPRKGPIVKRPKKTRPRNDLFSDDANRNIRIAEQTGTLYISKVLKAIGRYKDPLDRSLAAILTRSETLEVLRGLDSKVKTLSAEFPTAESRVVALYVLDNNPHITPENLITAVRGITGRPPVRNCEGSL